MAGAGAGRGRGLQQTEDNSKLGLGRGRGRGRLDETKDSEDAPPPGIILPSAQEPGTGGPDGGGETDSNEPAPAPNLPTAPSEEWLGSSGQGIGRGRGRGRGRPTETQPPTQLGVETTPLPPAPAPVTQPKPSSKPDDPKIVVDESKVMGTKGTNVKLVTNFLRLSIAPGKGVYEYHVTTFNPEFDSTKERKKLLHSMPESQIPATKTFDGAKLCLADRFENNVVTYQVPNPSSPGQNVQVQLTFVRQMPIEGAAHFYNVLLRRVMELTGLSEINHTHYDSKTIITLPPQHKLEIWRGFDTAASEFKGGLMVCVETCHRVLAKTTVLQLLKSIQTRYPSDWQDKFKENIVGRSVLTRYNNVFYKIHDVDFGSDPTTEFELRSKRRLSFEDYYKEKHGERIFDLKQPLLVSRIRATKANPMGVGPPALLVPELCYMTGITDDMRSNFNVMKDLIQKTRISPEERLAHVVKFATRIYGNQEAMALLHKWGLRLDTTSVDVDGRVLGQPEIRFNDRMAKLAPNDNDFTRTVTSNPCFRPVDLKRWTILVAAKDRALAATFDRTYNEVSRIFGIRYSPPDIQMVKGNGNYITGKDIRKHIQDNVQLHDTQFLVIIMSQQRDEPYAATKQELLVANSIPSQVILAKTLSNDRKLRSIVQKIVLQINCKLGGANWALQIRVPGQIMFVGIDTYHDPKRKDKSVLAMVATLDNECTKFYSTVALQTPHQEFGDSLGVLFTKVLNAYVATNHQLPARVVVFRDGIGDGQHDLVINHEVPAMKEALEYMPDDEGKVIANTKFTFIITQKRINERLFVKPMGGASLKNPIPGTIVDQTITRKGKYDFFLVSQNVTQGTVTPTHYHVVEDCGEYKPDMIQKMAYFMTYMYFNWPGSIRVPAVCQYAHKLAYLVGQHLKNVPKEENSWKLYYL